MMLNLEVVNVFIYLACADIQTFRIHDFQAWEGPLVEATMKSLDMYHEAVFVDVGANVGMLNHEYSN